MADRETTPHDAIAKRLYRDPRVVADLLGGFLPQSLAAQLDLATLEELPAAHVGGHLQRRSGDALWRVRRLGQPADRRDWVYVLVLLEFQSSVDPFMALRILTYTGLAYESLLQRGTVQRGERLPPVLPFVVHGGERRWSAPRDVVELIAETDAELAALQPRNHYLLLDENATRADDLPKDNLVAAQIALKHHAPDAGAMASWLDARLDGPEHAELRRAFTQWGAYWHERGSGPPGLREAWRRLADTGDIESMGNMFERQWAELAEKHRQEGREEQIARERSRLSRQTQRKFDLETAAQLSELLPRIADPDRLIEIGDAIIDCPTGAELLERSRRVALDKRSP